MRILVQKFGGTSVADIDRLKMVRGKVKAALDQGYKVVVVLSAKSGLYMDVADTFNNYSDRQGISLPNGNSESAGYPFAGSPMFRPSTSPGHRYLIETNPMFTNMGLFYGSDYFLSRIGLDQDRQQVVLLGDAFYETRLVQQQIMDATGQRFLNGYSSDADQMRGLMDNAVAQASELKLAAGVALTSTQVAALTDDIVWLVEQEVNGQKVMVPQVYLASNSKNAVITGGSLVAANNVSITAGAATNSGSTIRGNNLSMLADNINNAGGGVLTGGAVQLAAAQDIRNSGSTISGNNVTLAAGRDIVSEARIVGGNGVTRLGETGGIAAADGLQMLAGRDVTLAGSRLAAGGAAAGSRIAGAVRGLRSAGGLRPCASMEAVHRVGAFVLRRRKRSGAEPRRRAGAWPDREAAPAVQGTSGRAFLHAYAHRRAAAARGKLARRHLFRHARPGNGGSGVFAAVLGEPAAFSQKVP